VSTRALQVYREESGLTKAVTKAKHSSRTRAEARLRPVDEGEDLELKNKTDPLHRGCSTTSRSSPPLASAPLATGLYDFPILSILLSLEQIRVRAYSPERLAWPQPACSPRPLHSRGARDGDDQQGVHPRERVVEALLGEAGVHHVHHALHRHTDRRATPAEA
jgi:hypothetical protein